VSADWDRPEWTFVELQDLRARVRRMGRDFDLTDLSDIVGREPADVDRALFALMGRTVVEACEALS
jgi:hypothetical protein